jgi:putative aminopeptidase FrvX
MNNFDIAVRSLLGFCCVAVLLSTVAVGQGPSLKISTEDELKADMAQGPCKNADRLDAVKKLFQRMGATDADMKVEDLKDVKNLVLTKKGTTADETVVIGAHYDKVDAGCGTMDNWSGVVILAHLYRTLNSGATRKTYVFVAFGREEEGLKGSAAMVKAIPKEERSKYCSMVNLDSFGLGYPLILENASTASMIKFAKDLGSQLKVPVQTISLPGAADADSSSFKGKDIPAITMSALNNTWPEYMHTSKDKMDIINPASIRLAYQFNLQYVAKIDEGACTMFRDK